MSDPAIVAEGVRKHYGAVEALRGVDLTIATGEVFALLGPNGAGKTTLVEILEGYRSATSGEISVLGRSPDRPNAAWRARIGIVLQNTTVFDWLTVEEVIRHFAGFYPRPRSVDELIDEVQIGDKRSARCASLSGGQKRRVDLALGLVGDPDLIFLDEPTTGLDPEARRQLWGVIQRLAKAGKTVVLTTHYLEEAEVLADRVGIILGGAIVDVGPTSAIGGRDRAASVVRFREIAGASLPELPGEVVADGDFLTVSTNLPTAVVQALTEWSQTNGEPEIPGLTVTRPSLEDIYLGMVRAAEGNDR